MSVNSQLKRSIWKRDGYICQNFLCSTKVTDTTATVDHIKPIWKGGTDKRDNLQTLCRKCNLDKGKRESPIRIYGNR